MRHAPQIRTQSTAGRVPAVAATLCLALLFAYWVWSRHGSRVIFDDESAFGRVRVVENATGLRSLYMGAGRARQSAVFPGRPKHLEIAYTRAAMVGLALTPSDGRILFVGLGGGAMPMYTRQVMPEARIDVVEIDAMIVDVAQRHFGFRPDSQLVVHTGDGRAFIEQGVPPGSYDLIVLDAFSDDEIPFALTTVQFLEAVRTRLSPRGIVASNLWSSQGEYFPMLATYDSVFGQVHLVRVGRGSQRILIASTRSHPLDRSALVEASRTLAKRVDLGFDLPGLVGRGYERPPKVTAAVLEDRESGPSLN